MFKVKKRKACAPSLFSDQSHQWIQSTLPLALFEGSATMKMVRDSEKESSLCKSIMGKRNFITKSYIL